MVIPSVHLPTHPLLIEKAASINPTILKGHLEKYNVTQVDQLLIESGVADLMGDTIDSKERFANELNKYAKQWPIEVNKQTKLIESNFSGSIDKEISFWKEMDKMLNETKAKLEVNYTAY